MWRPDPWPEGPFPQAAFSDPAQLFPEDASEWRARSCGSSERDEPVLAVKITASGEDAGVSTRLGKGQNALLRINCRRPAQTGRVGFSCVPRDRVMCIGPEMAMTAASNPPDRAWPCQDHRPSTKTNDEESQPAQRFATDHHLRRCRPKWQSWLQAQATGRLSLAFSHARTTTMPKCRGGPPRPIPRLEDEVVRRPPHQKRPRSCPIRTRRWARLWQFRSPGNQLMWITN